MPLDGGALRVPHPEQDPNALASRTINVPSLCVRADEFECYWSSPCWDGIRELHSRTATPNVDIRIETRLDHRSGPPQRDHTRPIVDRNWSLSG